MSKNTEKPLRGKELFDSALVSGGHRAETRLKRQVKRFKKIAKVLERLSHSAQELGDYYRALSEAMRKTKNR